MNQPKVASSLLDFDSAAIATAIEHFEVRDPTTGYANNELTCQTPEIAVPMVSYAFTRKIDTTTQGDNRPARVDELIALLSNAPKPFVLVVQYEGFDHTRGCVFGDMFCSVLHKLVGVGIVTDA